jgi:hypothetical protein
MLQKIAFKRWPNSGACRFGWNSATKQTLQWHALDSKVRARFLVLRISVTCLSVLHQSDSNLEK